jgi:protoheme ferro-lyase
MSGPKSAILLLAHGSPESPADIPEFMKHITGGRPVPDAVMKEVTHRYSLIGKSPLTEITMRQAEALQARLGLPVYVGMRNWKPFIGYLPGAAKFFYQRRTLQQGTCRRAQARHRGAVCGIMA